MARNLFLEGSITDVKDQLFPDYSQYCLHRIPGTVAELLEEEVDRESLPEDTKPSGTFENIVLILLDGFGFKHWKENSENHSFLTSLKENGETTRLTSIYPSETAAATTSINTGLTASKHGLIGWNMYFEEFEAYIKTLPYTTLKGENPEEVFDESPDPKILFEGESIHKLLSDRGVNTHAVIPRDIKDTEASNLSFEGAEQKPYLSLADLSVKLREELESSKGKNYFYTYIPVVDKISHFRGTYSEEYEAQLSQVSNALQENFLRQLNPEEVGDTLLILTADHGFTDTDPEENIDITEYEIVEENLDEKSNGDKILPFGSPRNVHLKLKKGKTGEVKEFLEEELDAHIWTKEEALDQELFGESYREGFEKRIGDLIICHKEVGVWHSEEKDELDIIGFHGGLTKEEMEIPFITAKLEDLT